MYIGNFHIGDTFDFKFTTSVSGVGATLSGSPAVKAYVGNSTTEISAGITLSVDFDSVTGLNNVRVVATTGNGYAAAINVYLVVTAGTVGGVSVVGTVIGSFSIDAREADSIIVDAIPADGTLPTLRQALYMINQFNLERIVSGTTVTIRKVDGSTALLTCTLSDATLPVSITRAT